MSEIAWRVWGIPKISTAVLASLLLRHRSTEVSQTLHGVWPSYGLVQYVYFLRTPYGILLGAKFTLHLSLAFSYIGIVTAWHSSNGHLPNFAAWYKEWNYGTFTDGATYMAGRPSRWASAHISILCCSTFLLIAECVLLL